MKVSWFKYMLDQVEKELPCHRHPMSDERHRDNWCMSRTCDECVFSEFSDRRAIKAARIRKIEL